MLRREIQRLKGDLHRVRQEGSFARNVMHTFRGNAMVTLSQLLLTPIVARIYGPDAYGIYGLFMAISLNLGTVAEMGYLPAFMLPGERERFHDLVRLSLLLLGVLVALLVPVLLVRESVFDLFPAWYRLGDWFYLLPLGVMVAVLPTLQVQWLFREKAFKPATTIGGTSNVALRLFNISFGWTQRGALHGLIVGELVVRSVQAWLLGRALRPHGWSVVWRQWHLRRIASVAREYIRYPLYIFPERWMGMAGAQVPIFMLVAWPDAVGRYAFAMGLMQLPLRQFGYSLSTVFQQKAAEVQRDRPDELPGITLELYRRLLLIGAPLFAIATFFGDAVFATMLGETWRLSGAYAAVLGPMFLLRMLTEPIGSLAYVKRQEQLPLWFQSMLLVARVGVVVWARPLGVAAAMLAYALVSTAGYLVYAALLLRAAGLPFARAIPRSLAWIALCAGVAAALRRLVVGDWWPTL